MTFGLFVRLISFIIIFCSQKRIYNLLKTVEEFILKCQKIHCKVSDQFFILILIFFTDFFLKTITYGLEIESLFYVLLDVQEHFYIFIVLTITQSIEGISILLSHDIINSESENESIQALVEVINDIDVLFDAVNKTFGMLMLTIISHDFMGGFVTMFMLAQKVASRRDIFSEDDFIMLYIICIIYIQIKIMTFSYISHRAYEKAEIVHKLCSKSFNRIGRIEILDIHTDIAKLGCGFFNFDWNLFNIVFSTEIIYFVAMVQLQQTLNSK
ncbi:hypothetical protein ACKWTF_006547 [Chironomus riparius]